MLACTHREPSQRPSFRTVVIALTTHLAKEYPDSNPQQTSKDIAGPANNNYITYDSFAYHPISDVAESVVYVAATSSDIMNTADSGMESGDSML